MHAYQTDLCYADMNKETNHKIKREKRIKIMTTAEDLEIFYDLKYTVLVNIKTF